MTKKQKIQIIRKEIASLEKKYPDLKIPEPKEPLGQLLVSIISLSSPASSASKALQLFDEEFVDWNEVRVSAVSEIASVLARAGIEEDRARMLKSVLGELFLKKNQLSMDFLLKYKEKQAHDFLNRFVGLDPAAVDEVMLLSLGHARFPVTAKVLRVCRSLGVAGDREGNESVAKLLMAAVPKSSMAEAYLLFTAHADHVKVAKPVKKKAKTTTRKKSSTAKKTKAKPGSSSKRKTAAKKAGKKGAKKASKNTAKSK